MSISLVNLSISKSIPFDEINSQGECKDFSYQLNYSKVTNSNNSQFETIYTVANLGQNKKVTIKPYYLDLFQDDLNCLGKIVEISSSSEEILVGVNQLLLQIFKFVIYIINFLILFKIKKLNIFNLSLLNLLCSLNINLLLNYNFLFTTDYKYFSPSIELVDSILISFVAIGISKKGFHSPKDGLSIKLSNKLLSVIFGVYILRIIQIYISRFQYVNVVEEWLVNYNYGFLRRGFIGTALVKIIEQFNVDIFYLFIFLIFFFNFLFFQILKKRLINKDLSFIELLMLLSPLFINYNLFWKSTITFPKELLGFIFFVYYLTYQAKIRTDARYLICFIALLNIGIYSHEINLWFLLSILLIMWTKKDVRDFRLTITSLSSAITFISIHLINIPKYANTAEDLCNNFYSKILDTSACYKASVLSSDLSQNIDNASAYIFQSNNLKYYLMAYTIYFLFGMFPLIINGWFLENKSFLLVALIFFTPLFYTTLDWGRWLHIYFSIIYFYFLYSDTQHNRPKANNLRLNKYMEVAILIIYSTYWSVPQCCVTDYTFIYLLNFSKFNLTIYFAILLIIYRGLITKYKSAIKSK